jgi:hypothetical protein
VGQKRRRKRDKRISARRVMTKIEGRAKRRTKTEKEERKTRIKTKRKTKSRSIKPRRSRRRKATSAVRVGTVRGSTIDRLIEPPINTLK